MVDVMDNVKTFFILILIVYSVVVSMLYWHQYQNSQNYQKEKDDILAMKEKDLANRESIVVDKEICFRELTKLKTIQSTAMDVLKSYSIVVPDETNKNKTEHLENSSQNSLENIPTSESTLNKQN